MKRYMSVLLALLMVLGLCACGQKADVSAPADVPTWQEQYDLGIRYLSEGNYEEAIIAFTAAIKIDPKRPAAYFQVAEAYEAMGDVESAINILTEGAQATGDPDLSQYLAQFLEDNGPEERIEQMLRQPGTLSYADIPEVFGMNFDALAGTLGQELLTIDDNLDGRTAWVNGMELGIPLQGAVYQAILDDVGMVCSARSYAPPGSGQWTNLHVDRAYRMEEKGYGYSIGWKDIRTGDTVDAVLEKLGLGDAAAILANNNPDYGSLSIYLYEDQEPQVTVYNEVSHGIMGEPARAINVYFAAEHWVEESNHERKDISRCVTLTFENMEYLYRAEYTDEIALMALAGG